MLTADHPTTFSNKNARTTIETDSPAQRRFFGRLGGMVYSVLTVWRSKKQLPDRITSPGQALGGFKVSQEDAKMIREMTADPDRPRLKLRAGPATPRRS